MTLVFEAGRREMWWSVLKPICHEAMKRGLPVRRSGALKETGEYCICCRACPRPEASIYVPHGVSVNELSYTIRQLARKYNWLGILFPGPLWQEKLDEAEHKVRFSKVVGWPKADILASPKIDTLVADIRTKYDLGDRQTVLFTGSWTSIFTRSGAEARYAVWKSLRRLTERRDVNILIRPHINEHTEIPERVRAERMIWTNPDDHGDIMPFLQISDVLAVDGFSSVSIEFLLFNRPIVFWYGTGAAEKIGSLVEPRMTGEEVEKALDGEDTFGDTKKWWKEQMIYKPDGHASERAVDAIVEMTQ